MEVKIGEKPCYTIYSKKNLDGGLAWCAHPKPEDGVSPDVTMRRHPFLYSSKSQYHLESLIAFVEMCETEHSTEEWNDLFSQVGLI